MDVLLFFTILVLAVVQNVSFTMVSRSRNRSSWKYHLICAIGSNSIWFLTMQQLVRRDMIGWLVIPYIIGTVSGSLIGVIVSQWVENKVGATADGVKYVTTEDSSRQLREAETRILEKLAETGRYAYNEAVTDAKEYADYAANKAKREAVASCGAPAPKVSLHPEPAYTGGE